LKSGKYHFRISGASLLFKASPRYGKIASLFLARVLETS
jgi:predicted nuclease of restriction endonuclease-like RecB superfamily